MSSSKTNIWIDTGGTFTDCIIKFEDGSTKFIKVLSDGSIRARIRGKVGDTTYTIDQNWGFNTNIINSYQLKIEGKNDVYCIKNFDPQKNTIELDRSLESNLPLNISISNNEEAPILAIRLGLELNANHSITNASLKLGTTKGTNALLEGKGSKVCLICTKGFKDLSVIGTQQRPNIFQIDIPDAKLLYSESIELNETVDAKGNIKNPLQISGLEHIQNLDYDSIALAFKNAHINQQNEEEVYETLRKITKKPISVSSKLSKARKLLNRTQSTLINAYLDPILIRYFDGIKDKIQNEDLSIMSSMGTLVNSELFRSMDALLSGPAGGLKGATQIASNLGIHKILSFDMGGTSTDVARYDRYFDYQYRSNIGGFETSIPSLAIETVAAGGGSICSFEDGQLKVGPKSAGAHPGPASYGQGGPLTITDVNLLLGKLNPEAFQFPLDIESATQKLYELSTISNINEDDLLQGFEKIANQKMAAAIRKISIQKGFHTAEYTLVSFGGAGGLHACKIAEAISIKKVIFPYASGLLSAYGIGHSNLEKIFSHSIIDSEIDNHFLKRQFDLLESEAFNSYQHAGISSESLICSKRWLTISLKGQEGTLDIDWTNDINIKEEYFRHYREIFGFLPDNFILEIHQIHLLMGEKKDDEIIDSLPKIKQKATPEKVIFNPIEGKNINVYNWDLLIPGDYLEGPAILYNGFGSVFLEDNWILNISEGRQAVAEHISDSNIDLDSNEAINLTVFSNRFQQIAEEMGTQLQKTAYSVNVKERLDFSCGILNPEGMLIANAPHIPVHLGSLGMCARLVLEKLSLKKGDVIITNHPKYGGSHLPDITLIKAVFDSEDQLIGYLINRAHHAEIGGSRPGSMPPDARTLEEEGVVFEPQYLAQNGVFKWESIKSQLENASFPSRAVTENIADMKAAVASLIAGENALQVYTQKMGRYNVHYYMKAILNNSSGIISKSLEQYKERSIEAEERMDDGRLIKVKISERDGIWDVDFDGTGAIHPENLNANESIIHSAVMYVLRLLVNREIPLNEGLMEHVNIKLPTSFLNPEFSDNPSNCPAVVGGNTEVSQRVVDTLLKAFRLSASSQGTMNNLLFGNNSFGYYETICGGTGASENQPGRSAIHQHMTNTRITDPEDLERNYPVRIHEFSIRKGSGGKGIHDGGDGIIREIEFLEEVEFTIISQHRKVPPFGLHGGGDGKVGEQMVIRKNGQVEHLEGVDKSILYPGDRIRISTPGGGAWGKSKISSP